MGFEQLICRAKYINYYVCIQCSITASDRSIQLTQKQIKIKRKENRKRKKNRREKQIEQKIELECVRIFLVYSTTHRSTLARAFARSPAIYMKC